MAVPRFHHLYERNKFTIEQSMQLLKRRNSSWSIEVEMDAQSVSRAYLLAVVDRLYDLTDGRTGDDVLQDGETGAPSGSRMDVGTNERTDERTVECSRGRTDGRMQGRKDGLTVGRTDGRAEGRTDDGDDAEQDGKTGAPSNRGSTSGRTNRRTNGRV